MSQYASPWSEVVAAEAAASERMAFIRRTYAHLTGAIIGFVVLEAILLQTPLGGMLLGLVGAIPFGWLLFLGAFMLVSWIADSWAHSSTSKGVQYAGLTLYVVAEAVLFAPLMTVAIRLDPAIPMAAGVTTIVMFLCLTAIVFMTRTDFSFLGPFLMIAGLAAFGVIGAAIIFQFALGPIFSVIMVALAAGYILYYTSNVLHHYGVNQHVAASLTLFASVALLFWYIVQLYMAFDE